MSSEPSLISFVAAFLSWDTVTSGIDIEHELALVTALSPEGDIAKSGKSSPISSNTYYTLTYYTLL
jgi:hypothetical protein